MHLVFFDESKDDPAYRHYDIGGVCIGEEHLAEVEQSVNAIAERAFGSSELIRETELHASDIYHRKSNFKDCPDFGERLALLSDFAKIMSLEIVRLIHIRINCDKLQGGQAPKESPSCSFASERTTCSSRMGRAGC